MQKPTSTVSPEDGRQRSGGASPGGLPAGSEEARGPDLPGGGPQGAGGKIPMAALLTLILGAFMAILDGSIVNVALPRMMSIFGSTADQIQWVLTGYMLASGVVIPVTGYLSDRFGGKKIYILSLGAFTVGSAMCALSWSNNSLVVARVIQAVGGGMMMPVSMAMIYYIVPRDKIGTALGIWGVTAMLAPSIGPTLGGYLVDNFSWHWIFTINIPIGIAAVFLSLAILRETPVKSGLKADFPGIILSVAGCFALLLALSEGQDKGWTSLYIVNLFIFSGFTLALFVIWELSTDHPMLDIRLLKNTTFAASLVCISIATVGLFSAIFLIPLFVQNVQGLTPLQTGLMMMPAALASGIIAPISGRLFDKVGALPLCLVGLTVTIITTYQLHTITYDISYRELQMILVERSLGLGLCMMPLTTAGMNTIPHFLIGRASALGNTVRQISASFGIAYLTYVMLHRQGYHAALLADSINWSSPAATGTMQQMQGVLSQAGYSPQGAGGILSALVMREALVSGIADAFLVSTVIVAIAMPFVFFLGKKRVEKQRVAEYKRYAHLAPPGGPPGGSPGGGGPGTGRPGAPAGAPAGPPAGPPAAGSPARPPAGSPGPVEA